MKIQPTRQAHKAIPWADGPGRNQLSHLPLTVMAPIDVCVTPPFIEPVLPDMLFEQVEIIACRIGQFVDLDNRRIAVFDTKAVNPKGGSPLVLALANPLLARAMSLAADVT